MARAHAQSQDGVGQRVVSAGSVTCAGSASSPRVVAVSEHHSEHSRCRSVTSRVDHNIECTTGQSKGPRAEFEHSGSSTVKARAQERLCSGFRAQGRLCSGFRAQGRLERTETQSDGGSRLQTEAAVFKAVEGTWSYDSATCQRTPVFTCILWCVCARERSTAARKRGRWKRRGRGSRL